MSRVALLVECCRVSFVLDAVIKRGFEVFGLLLILKRDGQGFLLCLVFMHALDRKHECRDEKKNGAHLPRVHLRVRLLPDALVAEVDGVDRDGFRDEHADMFLRDDPVPDRVQELGAEDAVDEVKQCGPVEDEDDEVTVLPDPDPEGVVVLVVPIRESDTRERDVRDLEKEEKKEEPVED